MLLAACDEGREVGSVLRAARSLGIDDDALDAAVRAGLLSMSEGEIRFRHPLVRSAVYQHASLTERQGPHRALADALDSPEQADRRAWHRASACVGFDEAVASELEDTAERAARRGGYAGAARALERSAELTPDPSVRMRRLVAAADTAIMSGQTDHGLALLDTAERPDAPVELSGEMSRLRGIAELRQRNPVHAFELLSEAADRERDPSNALRLLLLATEAGSYAGRVEWIVGLGRRASKIEPPDPLDRFRHRFLTGIGLILEETQRLACRSRARH